jgi:hypothetical protein
MKELKKELDGIRKHIPYNTYKTILGQMKTGQVEAAKVGIERLKKKLNRG